MSIFGWLWVKWWVANGSVSPLLFVQILLFSYLFNLGVNWDRGLDLDLDQGLTIHCISSKSISHHITSNRASPRHAFSLILILLQKLNHQTDARPRNKCINHEWLFSLILCHVDVRHIIWRTLILWRILIRRILIWRILIWRIFYMAHFNMAHSNMAKCQIGFYGCTLHYIVLINMCVT